MERCWALLSLFLCVSLWAAPLPPLVCPAGGPIGSVDLRVISARGGEALPLRTINRLEEGDQIVYKPLLRAGEKRGGEVAVVLLPENKAAAPDGLTILDPKPANEKQQWKVPWRVGVIAFVYGPAGLDAKKVKKFVSRDEDIIGQLADYAEKQAQTEALLATLASPNSSTASVQAALQGFSSQYGMNTQLDRNAPANQQAMTVFRTVNPAIAGSGYDPLAPQLGQQAAGQTASLATSVATLFFGSPVGLAAGGTAMLMELRAAAFPKVEFRSSLSQSIPNDGLGLCGRRDAAPPHTKVAYLWATRVPNSSLPQLTIDKANSLPAGLKSPLPVGGKDTDWKFIDRARNWTLQPENGKPLPVKVVKLGDTHMLELELSPDVKPGKYTLAGNWDWDPFQVKGPVIVRALSNFDGAKLLPASQDMLVSRTGKIPVVLEGTDYEFVTKVEIEKLHDKFATPVTVPFLLPQGVRQGPQERLDVQVNTIDLDPGEYKLLLTQLDGAPHALPLKILPAPPRIENLPVSMNEGTQAIEFTLKGEQLQLLQRIEIPRGKVELGASAAANQTERGIKLQMSDGLAAGTSLTAKAFIQDRNEPLTLSDAVRIVGPRPLISEVRLSQPAGAEGALQPGEIQGSAYLSAMMRVKHLQSNSVLSLGCGEAASNPPVELKLGQRNGALNLQQLAPDQVFVSFDSGAWVNGCELQARVANGNEGKSEVYRLGRIVRLPKIERLDLSPSTDAAPAPATAAPVATLTGQNLEMIEKASWTPEDGEAVHDLPLPVPGDAQRQTLALRLAPPPSPESPLYVWLRGDAHPRAMKVGL